MSIKLNFKTSNPLMFKSREVDLLERSYEDLQVIMKEYAAAKNLAPEELEVLQEVVRQAFTVKKAEFFIGDKLNKIAGRIDLAVCNAFHTNEWNSESPHHTSLVYMKHSKHQFTNE